MEKLLYDMKNYGVKKLSKIDSPGVYWQGGYPEEYSKYETNFPFAFPYANPDENEAPRFTLGSDGYWYNPLANNTGRALLCCCGDLMCEPKQHRAYHYGNQYFFQPEFKFIRNVLKGADFSIANLETTLTDRTPYAGTWHRIEGKYHCNAPKSYLDALRYAGFDALVNANNHNCDSAVAGLIDTLDALDEYRFMHTGTFHPTGDPRFILVNINGLRVAILSYATYFNQLETNFTELGRRKLLNVFDAEKAKKDVAAARTQGAEFVLSYIHWGREYTHKISEEQQLYAKQLADAGVDYIVGSHSHSLQPRRTVQAENGKVVPVVYSMGNLVTNESRRICKHTGILQLSLKRTPNGVSVTEAFIPCYVFNEIRGSAYAPVPTDITLNGGLQNKTLQSADPYIQGVMSEIAPPLTAAIDIDSVCSILSVPRPDSIPNAYLTRLCTAPLNVTAGCLYFGIIWNSVDELKEVRQNGAAVIVTNRAIEGLPCLVVPDVNQAYCAVYSAIKRRFSAKTALITGSVGKTTTKEILERVIATEYQTLASPGNWNTRHTGMLIMQRLRDYHDFYVQEVYEGDAGSARMLSEGLLPDYAIITNIDSPHRENFDSDESFFRCFTDITAGLKEDGILFVNGDDERLMNAVAMLEKKPKNIITFGIHGEKLQYRAENIVSHDGWISANIVYAGNSVPVKMHTPVEKNAYSIAAAFALGLSAGIAPQKIADAISTYESDGIRQNVLEYRGLQMMLDCRSAAPTSMESTIHAFCNLQPQKGGKRVAVIGDMHLNEEESEREHRKVGELIAASNIDCLLCYGKESEYVYDEALEHGFPYPNALHCPTKRMLEKVLYNLLEPGDTLLIKGGRRMYLNSTIRKLFGYTFSID